MGGHKITVYSETRRELVPEEAFLGTSNSAFLLDRTVRHLPESQIMVASPYFTRKLLSKCISDPLYDVVSVNVPLVRELLTIDPTKIGT